MLEQFHIQESDAVRIDHRRLYKILVDIFTYLGCPVADAAQAADVLVTTDLRGVESHGISGQFKTYIKEYQSGVTNPKPKPKIVRETHATANMDSDRGLGIIVAPQAMDIAIEKAKKYGVGMVTIHNGRHMGMCAYTAMKALEHDMIGVAMTSAGPTVVPTFGSIPRLGTNPICLAAPAHQESPFVYDGATSAIAGNKIGIAKRLGSKLMPGWIPNYDGTPILEEIDPPSWPHPALLPLGSTREMGSQKGYGLGCVVSILTGILSGGGFDSFPGRPYYYHMVAAYAIEAFNDKHQFKIMMDDFIRSLKATPPAPGYERVLVPGQPEEETQREREQYGIPVHKEVVGWLEQLCLEFGLSFKIK